MQALNDGEIEMRWFVLVLTGLFFVQAATAQQSYVPDRRIVVSRDVDFYGADLQSMFDTTYDACVQSCLADDNCAAFTFNSRSNACFPKSAVNDTQPYEGAISARVYRAAPGAQREVQALDLAMLRYQADMAM